MSEKAANLESRLDKKIVIPWMVLVVAFGLSCAIMLADLIVSRKSEEKVFLRKAENVLNISHESWEQTIEKSKFVLRNLDSEFIQIFRAVQKEPQEGDDVSERLASIASVNAQLKSIALTVPEINPSSLRMANENGDVVFHSGESGSEGKININGRSYFEEMKNSSQVFKVFKPIELSVSGKWVIPLSMKLKKEGGGFGGVAILFLRGDYYSDGFKNLEAGEKSAFSLMGIDGESVTITPETSKAVEERFDTDILFKKISSGDVTGYIDAKGKDGGDYLLRYVSSNSSPYVIVSMLSKDDMYQAWQKKAGVYLMATFLIFFMLWSLWRLSKQRQDDVARLHHIKDEFDSAKSAVEGYISGLKRTLKHSIEVSNFIVNGVDVARSEGRLALADKSVFNVRKLSFYEYLAIFNEKETREEATAFDLKKCVIHEIESFKSRISGEDVKMTYDIISNTNVTVLTSKDLLRFTLELLLCVISKRVVGVNHEDSKPLMDLEVKVVEVDEIAAIRINAGNGAEYSEKEWKDTSSYIANGGLSEDGSILDLHLSLLVRVVKSLGGNLECNYSDHNMWFVINVDLPITSVQTN